MKKFSKGLFILFFLTPNICIAINEGDYSKCTNLFYKKIAPQIVNQKLNAHIYNYCYADFGVSYSGISKTGIWSAEYITPQKLKLAQQFPRQDNFSEELAIPEHHRAKLSDYRGSGYDRGHLSASAQRTSKKAQSDSYVLSNIFPQASLNNQGLWADIEKATRTYIKKTNNSAYIITGTMFLGPKLKTIGNGVLIPTHVYKVIFFPNLNVGGAYVAVNDNSGRVDTVSLKQLENYSGMAFFPTEKNNHIFNIRFNLPMTSNQATKIKFIKKNVNNQSPIFSMLPSALVGRNKSRKPNYVENRNVAAELGVGIADDVKNAGINMIKKVLE